MSRTAGKRRPSEVERFRSAVLRRLRRERRVYQGFAGKLPKNEIERVEYVIACLCQGFLALRKP